MIEDNTEEGSTKANEDADSLIQQREMEAQGKLSEEAFQMDAGSVFIEIQNNFKKYDRMFLKEVVWTALKSLAVDKHIEKTSNNKFYNKGSNLQGVEYLRRQVELYQAQFQESEDESKFPFPDFFIYFFQGRPERLLSLDQKHIMHVQDTHFMLFFSLKLSLLHFVDVPSFLSYHLSHSFEEKIEALHDFFNQAVLFYPDILSKYQPILEDFVSKKKVPYKPIEGSSGSTIPAEIATNEPVPKIGHTLIVLATDESIKEVKALVQTGSEKAEEEGDQTEKNGTDGTYRKPTTSQLVLIFHYLFEHLEITSGNDKTQLAEFIRFVTQRDTGSANITNTNIYKQLKKPINKGEKRLTEDLQFVRSLYENIGLQPVVKLITKEIDGLEAASKKSRKGGL